MLSQNTQQVDQGAVAYRDDPEDELSNVQAIKRD
jgi:hypothetical protein